MQKATKILAVAILVIAALFIAAFIMVQNNEPTTSINQSDNPTNCNSKDCIASCYQDELFAAGIRSSPECQGKDFKCVGGGEITLYYDYRSAKISQIEKGSPFTPQEVEKAAVAEITKSGCNCKKPIVYEKINIDTNSMEETNCESFYSFVQSFNSSCNGCLLSWVATYE